MKLLNNYKVKLIIVIFIMLLQIYFITINILKPIGAITYTWHPIIWATISIITFLIFGRHLLKIYFNLFKKIVDMDTLLGIASHTLFIYSIINSIINFNSPMYSYAVFWEGSTLLVLFSYIGRDLSNRLKNKSINGYKELLKLKSKTAIVYKSGKETEISLMDIRVGDIIIVKSNMKVPIDGVLVSTLATIDKSLVTGESKNILNKKNDNIISGTLNVGTQFRMRVTKVIEDSFIYVLIDKADDLSLSKPKIQIMVNKVLKYFIPTIFVISITAFITWIILGYGFNIQLSWFKGTNYLDNAILAFVTVLAIACPCALGIATPLIITIASDEANKNSLLFNNPESFEKIKMVKIVAFDKTGTLTTGKMEIVLNSLDKKTLEIVSAIENHSIHPIAKAICEAVPTKITIKKVEEIFGRGITAKYKKDQYSIMKSSLPSQVSGATIVEVKKNNKIVGKIELIDEIKINTAKTIEYLKKLKIKTILITGDSKSSVDRLGNRIQFDELHYSQTPDQKSEIIKKLRKRFNLKDKEQILYIGDGVNDLLALKQADISMAFSSGSDIANSFSDISILNQDIFAVVNTIKLSQETQRRIRWSLTWAFIFNVVALPVAFVMLISPWIAAIVMLLSDIAVILNSMYFKNKMNKYFKQQSNNTPMKIKKGNTWK